MHDGPWDAGTILAGAGDTLIAPLSNEDFITPTPKENHPPGILTGINAVTDIKE